MIRKNAYQFLLFFAVSGLLIALYSLKQHYAPLGGSACDINATFNCDLVNRGPYGEIAGFPVAGIGVIGYLMIGAVAIQFKKTRDPVLGKALMALLVGGIAFSLYLTSLEAFVIGAWCLLCLGSLSSIFGASLTGYMTIRQSQPSKPPAQSKSLT
jgi:uncharacterized membrane protein